MKRWLVFLLGVLVVLVGVAGGLWQLSRARSYQLFGDIVSRVDTNERAVALTFDDGPSARGLDALLPVLRERGIRATFFVVGSELARRPALGRQLVEEGHELGNHSYTHRQ